MTDLIEKADVLIDSNQKAMELLTSEQVDDPEAFLKPSVLWTQDRWDSIFMQFDNNNNTGLKDILTNQFNKDKSKKQAMLQHNKPQDTGKEHNDTGVAKPTVEKKTTASTNNKRKQGAGKKGNGEELDEPIT